MHSHCSVAAHRSKEQLVLVDDRFPVDADNRLVMAECRTSNCFWVPILEKAYAKLYGSYEAIESGSVHQVCDCEQPVSSFGSCVRVSARRCRTSLVAFP